MHKLLFFFAMLAVAFAAPAPEPGAAILAPALAYKAPLAYSAPLTYSALPAAPLYGYNTYNAQYAYPYPAYSAPYAYSKFF